MTNLANDIVERLYCVGAEGYRFATEAADEIKRLRDAPDQSRQEMEAQLRHLVDDLVYCPNPDDPTRFYIKPGAGLMFSNMVGAVKSILAQTNLRDAAPAPTIPEGFVLVPKEPDRKMCEACLEEARFQFGHGITIDAAVHLIPRHDAPVARDA